MNMKTLVILVLMGMTLSAFADEPAACQQLAALDEADISTPEKVSLIAAQRTELTGRCNTARANAGNAANREKPIDINSLPSQAGASRATICNNLINMFNDAPAPSGGAKVKTDDVKNCENLKALSGGTLVDINPREFSSAKTLDGAITCKMMASYTIDYASCEKAAAQYNFVLNAETAMDLQQKIRTDLKAKSIQEDAAKQAAEGNLQEGA